MKVRIRTVRGENETGDVFYIEVWRWYWPFWKWESTNYKRDCAVRYATSLLRPEITEIK